MRKPLKGETTEEWHARTEALREEWGISGNRMTMWDADHIVPVAEGGGLTGLENYATLCTLCHRQKTAEQAKRRRKS